LKRVVKTRSANPNKNKNNNLPQREMRFGYFWFCWKRTNTVETLLAKKQQMARS